MPDGTVGVKAPADATDYIDNEEIGFGPVPTLRKRQRVRIGGALATDLAEVERGGMRVEARPAIAPYRGVAAPLTITLDALAAGAWAASSAVDNSAALAPFVDIGVLYRFATAPVAGTLLAVYVIPSLDSLNYDDGATVTSPPGSESLVGELDVTTDTASQHRRTLRDVPIPPGLFLVVVRNQTAAALFASGNVLSYRLH